VLNEEQMYKNVWPMADARAATYVNCKSGIFHVS